MPDIKLCYFDNRGLAEVSRLVLALADQKYEDVRWTREEWPIKYQPETPFGTCPYLVYDGKKVGQSSAIACFLAREFGLYGKSNWDAAVIDQVIFIFKDIADAWLKSFTETDEAKKAEMIKQQNEEEYPRFFGHFVKLLRDNGSNGHFVGDSITLADLYVYDVMGQMRKVCDFDACAGAAFPELQAMYDKVGANPRIKDYVANRKETPM